MLKVGVTGGIGSGKTTVCQLFELHGVPVFCSDKVSKSILANDPTVREAVITEFGERSFNESGPDRAYLAEKVFSDVSALEQLNSILHPKVGEAFGAWCAEQNAPYVLKEAAILFESGANRGLDSVIVVTAPEELRLKRVMDRDGVSREDVLARMQRQMPQSEKDALADHLIHNDDSRSLIKQVNVLHEELVIRSKRS